MLTLIVPFVVDLVNREIIWMDIADTNNCAVNNVNNSYNTILMNTRSIINRDRTTMSDLVTDNVHSRGTFACDPEHADLICTADIKPEYEGKNIITPFELDKFMAEFM